MAVEIVYETHSTSTDNEAGIATGWNDGRLSERGKAQATELGRRRRDDGLGAIFSSDLLRAVETAAIAFRDAGLPVFFDTRLRECNYGAWNGAPVERLAGQRRDFVRRPYPGGQSYQDVAGAMAAFLEEATRRWDGRRILVIGHSATRWALEALVHEARLEDLVDAPFRWQEGWAYAVPADWKAPAAPG